MSEPVVPSAHEQAGGLNESGGLNELGGWREPGAHVVAEGVWRIPLPLPDDGLKAVNVYALEDGDGLTLIDGGWSRPEAREALESGLADIDRDLGHVRRILVTHVHRDHYSLAVHIRRDHGSRITLGFGDHASLAAVRLDGAASGRPIFDHLIACGAAELVEVLERHAPPPRTHSPDKHWALPDAWLDGTVTFDVGGRRLTAIPTPGHTTGHYVFHDPADDLLFGGDHVLPHITPSIGFESAPAPNPLAAFLDSLDRVLALPDARLAPAHGPLAPSTHLRCRELHAHHDVRLGQTLDAVRAGHATATEVAAVLPWTHRERRFDELDPFNQMLAVNETEAHLRVLRQRGAVVLETTSVDGWWPADGGDWAREQIDLRRYVVAAAPDENAPGETSPRP